MVYGIAIALAFVVIAMVMEAVEAAVAKEVDQAAGAD